MQGWSVNLSMPGSAFLVDMPIPALFQTDPKHPTMEVVFWSDAVERWVHLVSLSFVRDLPAGHVQAAAGDLAWIEQVVARNGIEGLKYCVAELEANMVPETQ
jgi:hypothetical protein